MLAASCIRQQWANSIDLAPAAWDKLPRAGTRMSTLLCSPYGDRKAKEQTGCIKLELGCNTPAVYSKPSLFGVVSTPDRQSRVQQEQGQCDQCKDGSNEPVRVLQKFGWSSNSDSPPSLHVSLIQSSCSVLCINHFRWSTDYSQTPFLPFAS